MYALLHSAAQKALAVIIALGVTVVGIFSEPRVVTIIPPQTATVYPVEVVALSPPETSSTPAASSITSSTVTDLPSSTQELLPKILPLPKTIATSSSPAPAATKKSAPPKPVPIPSSATVPQILTAQSLLSGTTLSLKQKIGGTYAAVLTATINGENLVWDLRTTTLGGNGSIPPLTPSFTCNPPPEVPLPDAFDQNPSFNVRTSYHCEISLTPLTGNDRRAQSKEFSFQTDSGPLIITPSLAMGTILRDDKNNGGFIFDNQDSQPVTLTGVTFDVSYTALNVSSVPLVLRFLDPVSEQTLTDYHLENLPENPSLQFTRSQIGLTTPLSFLIGPGSQKMLPMQVLGVRKMSVVGVDPAIKITLRGVTTDRSDAKISLNSPQISWTCIIPAGGYDPNATSGPFATGQACRD